MQSIRTPIVSSKGTFGALYSMHKYWARKSPDVVTRYIETYTKPGDIVLDPFSGSGVVPCEALRLQRKAIAVDLNPMAHFITRMTLTPVNLSRLRWAFEDLRAVCEDKVSELFVTRCKTCGKNAISEFVVRDGEMAQQIGYKCACSPERQFKEPDRNDLALLRSYEQRDIPAWFPNGVKLPTIRTESPRYVHDLFSRRNLSSLAMILEAIESIEEVKIRDLMKLTFTASLDKCSRLKPVAGYNRGAAKPTLRQGWVALHFYTPRVWQEVNPWHAFHRSFEQIYKGKKASNEQLGTVVLADSYEEIKNGEANVLLLNGPADKCIRTHLSRGSVDYVLTDPPYGKHIQFMGLSTLWGAWLKLDFDYENELVVSRSRGKSFADYHGHLEHAFRLLKVVLKTDNYCHVFCDDVQALHSYLRTMTRSRVIPQHVLYQPPAISFSGAVRNVAKQPTTVTKRGSYGSYIIEGKTSSASLPSLSHQDLVRQIARKVTDGLLIRNGVASTHTLIHSLYQSLEPEEILALAKQKDDKLIYETIKDVAEVKRERACLKVAEGDLCDVVDIKSEIRSALLDGWALFDDSKQQVYQRVLNQLADDALTIDDVSEENQKITKTEIKSHRDARLVELLKEFGEHLGHTCEVENSSAPTVIWHTAEQEKRVCFQIRGKNVFVKASLTKGDVQESDIGRITAKALKHAYNKWLRINLVSNRDAEELDEDNEIAGSKTMQAKLKVLDNKEICPGHHLVTLEIPGDIQFEPNPGQFLHIICDPKGTGNPPVDLASSKMQEGAYELAVRRPFSVHRVIYRGFDTRLLIGRPILPVEIKYGLKRIVSRIDILYKIVGEGTKLLSQVPKDMYLDVIGPVGRGFKIGNEVKTAILVAGGIGAAPLVALAERLRYLGRDVYLYFGALNKELMPLFWSWRSDSAVERSFIDDAPAFCSEIKNEFEQIGALGVNICTEDQTLDSRGLVTEELEEHLRTGHLPLEDATIYACGPSGMLTKVADIAQQYRLPCQVLLEERMACGIGACFSCVCKVRGEDGGVKRERVCADGPVFDARKIIWNH